MKEKTLDTLNTLDEKENYFLQGKAKCEAELEDITKTAQDLILKRDKVILSSDPKAKQELTKVISELHEANELIASLEAAISLAGEQLAKIASERIKLAEAAELRKIHEELKTMAKNRGALVENLEKTMTQTGETIGKYMEIVQEMYVLGNKIGIDIGGPYSRRLPLNNLASKLLGAYLADINLTWHRGMDFVANEQVLAAQLAKLGGGEERGLKTA